MSAARLVRLHALTEPALRRRTRHGSEVETHEPDDEANGIHSYYDTMAVLVHNDSARENLQHLLAEPGTHEPNDRRARYLNLISATDCQPILQGRNAN